MKTRLMAIPFLLWILCGAQVHAVLLDRIVAVVNDDIITWSELKQLELFVLQEMGSTALKDQLPFNQEQLLDDLIGKKIKLQKAEKLQITVSDEELDAAIGQILSNNHIHEEAFKEKLNEKGRTWTDYKKEIWEQMVISRLVNQEVRSKIILMPEELQVYYEKQFKQFGVDEKKQILRILFALPEKATDEKIQEVKTMAESLRHRIVSGEDFKEAAIRYSDGAEAGEGGNLGYFAGGELRSDLNDQVSQMTQGDISPVIQTEEGFILLKVEDIRAADYLSFDDVKDKVQEALYEEKLRIRYDAWIRELKEKAYIEKKP